MINNTIKALVEKIASTNGSVEDLMDELIGKIDENLHEGNTHEIEELLNQYLDLGQEKHVDPLMEAITFSIENIVIEIDHKEYESTMQLMPCTFAIKGTNPVLPSISSIEKKIRTKLLKNKIIEHPEQFHLGTVRLSQDAVSEMRITEWFNLHNDIINEIMSSGKENNEQLRCTETTLDTDKKISVFYLLGIFINRDSNSLLVSNMYESTIDINLWSSMTQDVGEKDVTITMFPPTSILEGIDNVNFVMQGLEFDIFFNEYAEPRTTDIVFAQVEKQKDEYVVLFVDNEEKTIKQYYIYDTHGDAQNFINVLLDKCNESIHMQLFRLENPISDEQLNRWATEEEDPDISELIENSDLIDINTSKKLLSINNPNFTAFTSSTVH